MSSRYEDGTAVYDVIRAALRGGRRRSVARIAQETGYSESYIRLWLPRMSDVIRLNTRPRLYRLKEDS